MGSARTLLLAWPLVVGLAFFVYDASLYADSLRAGGHIGTEIESESPSSHYQRVTDVFATALSPSHLQLSGSGPSFLPNATHLVDILLNDAFLNASVTYWQGNAAVLTSTLELLRSSREAPQAPTSQQQWRLRRQQQQQPSDQSAWLATVESTLAAVPAGPSSYPLLRRYVVALLLRAWLAAGKSWRQSDDEATNRILLQLYDLHRAGAANKSAIEYYHFSKAAGTSMCLASAEAGCTTFSTSEQFTCLIPAFGDGPRWINRDAHDAQCRRALPGERECPSQIYSQLAKWGTLYSSKGGMLGCEQRAAALAASGWNFYASEYTLRPWGGKAGGAPGLCGAFLNMAVLREPLPRLSSHLRFVVQVTFERKGNATRQFFRGMGLAGWRKLLPAALDNYYTRGLLGEEAFYVPLGGLNASVHLPAARAVLGAMDVLLLLEDSEPLSRLGHKWGLGWNTTLLEAEGRRSSDTAEEVSRIANEVLPSGADAESLAAANALDQELYEFAVLLSRLDAVVWAAAEAAGRDPFKGLRGKRKRRCGYVAAAPLSPGGEEYDAEDTAKRGKASGKTRGSRGKRNRKRRELNGTAASGGEQDA